MNLVHQISQETLTVEILSEGFGMQEIDLSRSRIDAMINLTVDKALRSLYEEKLRLEKPPVIQTEVSDRIVVAQPLPTVSLLSLSSQAKDVAIRFLQLAAGRWIGLEGVMSVQAYQDKGTDTLLKAAKVKMGEYLIFRVTGNPLLCALIGLALANTVVQLGIAPRQDFPYYVTLACGILVIGLIQSRFFTRLLEKLRLLKIGAR